MDTEQLADLLRAGGVTVQHIAPLPRAAGGVTAVAVFLDPTRNQRELARSCVRRGVEGVASVKFSGITPWVMFVTFTVGRTVVKAGTSDRSAGRHAAGPRPEPTGR